ncbi:MAG: DNA double-strand break repair nuclease NurA [Elainellaceae cyanobacterium]
MLDLTRLAAQMEGIGQYLNEESAAARRRLEKAQQVLEEALPHQAALVERQQIWRDRLGFTAAVPLEPLDTRRAIAAAPPLHTVLATDGSQIAPSHHEIAYCYLINVGRIVLHYGQNRHPLLDSIPEVFYRPQDLYVSRQWGIRTEEWMGYQRTVSEAVVLAELAHQLSPTHPTLAMVDGSLIHWFLEPLPGEARDRLLPPILQAWDILRQARIPLVGYLSASRSGEALNMLRLHTCPHPQPDCFTHCPGQTEQAPCQVFAPLRDTALWSVLLKPGQRSPLWRSAAKILAQYGDHPVYFCYIHVGTEVARLEFPQWVIQEPDLLETALTLAVEQVQKGYGYPVALAEAHNQAVVRGGDRARFFSLLEQQMIRAGLRNIGTSYKETRKRGSIA